MMTITLEKRVEEVPNPHCAREKDHGLLTLSLKKTRAQVSLDDNVS